MPEHQVASPKSKEKADQTRHDSAMDRQSSYNGLEAWDISSYSISDTSYNPAFKRHLSLLSNASSGQLTIIARQLQQTYGNRYVQRLIESIGVQAKLIIGASDTFYERDADRLAEQVMNTQTPEVAYPRDMSILPTTRRQIPKKEELLTKPPAMAIGPQSQQQVNSQENVIRTRLLAQRQTFEEEEEESIQTEPLIQRRTPKGDAVVNRVVQGIKWQPSNVVSLPQISPKGKTQFVIQRKPVEDELNEELAAWAKMNKKSIDREDPGFAFSLQEYAWSIIADPDTGDPISKPKKPKELKEWKKKFEKAGLLAEMILGGSKQVEQKEVRAGIILNMMARSGFSAKPVELTKRMKDFEQIEYVYSGVLGQVEKADAGSLTTITEAFIKKKGKDKNPIIEKLTDSSGSFEKKLSNIQLTAILRPIINAYESDAIIIEILSEVLVHKPGYRKIFSDWMWKDKKEELLFRILESKYFIEPDYGPTVFPEVGELKLEKDMPWVYANKQKYYVGYLIQLGKDGGQDIKAPKNLQLKILQKWLDEYTEAIGRALAKKYPDKPDKWIEVYEQLADIFFYHVSGRNIVPDPKGKLAKLSPGAPKKMRLQVDCDVLATYAMRFFRGVADPTNAKFKPFEPIGYMAVDPTDDEGHAVAMMRRDGTYYVISNKEVFKTTVVEKKKDEKKTEAKSEMKSIALTSVYNPIPLHYKIYYADAPDGALPKALSTTEESTRQADLEP